MTKPKNAKQAIKAAGPVIGAKELKQIEKKFGSNAVTKAKEYAKETPGVKFNERAKTFYKNYTTSAGEPSGVNNNGQILYPTGIVTGIVTGVTTGVTSGNLTPQYIDAIGSNVSGFVIPAGRYSEQEYNTLSTALLAKLAGDIEIEKEQTRGLYATRQQEIASAASKYGYDRDLEAKKYIADQALLKDTRVAEIEGQKKIDLQAIINAGLKDIEGIRGQTERDVETLRGEYGVKQESERQRGQRDIARIGSEAGFRNALIGAFSF